MKSLLLLTLVLLLPLPAAAAYAARDLVLPVAGRATGGDGRQYLTALWLTNPSERDAVDATLTFHPADEKLPAHASPLHLAAAETRLVDPIGAEILGVPEALGFLQINATRDLLVTARVYSLPAGAAKGRSAGTSFSAVPAQFAVGNGESATLQGVVPAEGRYKIYFAEVVGMPLDVSVALVDGRGMAIAEKRLYIDKGRQVTADASELFPSFTSGAATLRVGGVNGAGRVIVAGSAIARGSDASSPYEMSFATTARNRIGVVEALTYVAAAGVALAALLVRR